MSSRKLAALALGLTGAALGMPLAGLAQQARVAAESPADGGDMAARVRAALHADPALLDKHIDVVVQNGKVVLRGFVTTAEDLQKARRAADATAGKDNVVDQLTIKEGGDGGSG